MRMALRELRRRPRAFFVPVAILALLALLLLFPSSILDGIVKESTAAIRNVPADLVVYSRAANGVMPRSTIEPALRERIDAVPGTASVATLDVTLWSGIADGIAEPLGLALTASNAPLGPSGRKPAPGEAIADEGLREKVGLKEGTRIRIGPGETPVTVVGFAPGSNLWFANGMVVHKSTWRTAFGNPPPPDEAAAAAAEGLASQAVLVKLEPGAEPATVVAAIDEATGRETTSMTREVAVRSMPGIAEQEATFGYMRGITLTVALVVVALFLSFMTLERAPLYAALKAIGASSRQLFGALVMQVLLITTLAIATAAAITWGLTRLPSEMPTVMQADRVIETTFALGFTAVIGSGLSLRRVMGVDAKDALG